MKKLSLSYTDISTYRSELMGWAILWIMMLHFTFNQIIPLGFIAQYGFAGVDIFLFVSGFGLYFSLDKDNWPIRFYKRRLIRIFPTYYLLGIFASIIIFNDSILTYLYRYTTIGFWINGIYWEWYIPSLVILYILCPYIKKIIDINMYNLVIILVIGILLIAFLLIDKEYVIDRAHFFFLYRIPAFIFGMLCAYWMKKNFSIKIFYYLLLAGIPFFILFFPQHHQIYNYKYYSLIFLLPFFLLSFLLISKYSSFINPFISAIGKASLEIYLIQSIVFSAILNGMIVIGQRWHDTVTIILIVSCSLLGISVHWLIKKSGIQRLL